MYELDCLGDMCPIPLMKLNQHLNLLGSGEPLMLITDHSCVLESVTLYCRQRGLRFRVQEPMNGIWELIIEKNSGK